MMQVIVKPNNFKFLLDSKGKAFQNIFEKRENTVSHISSPSPISFIISRKIMDIVLALLIKFSSNSNAFKIDKILLLDSPITGKTLLTR